MNTSDRVTQEIVELHEFFTQWFNGTVNRDQLEPRFLSRLHPDLLLIPPEDQAVSRETLRVNFEKGFGANPDFKIQIRDVDIRYKRGDLVLANYTEWQILKSPPTQSSNARVSSVLLEMTDPITWIHIHESWLPEELRTAGSFDF